LGRFLALLARLLVAFGSFLGSRLELRLLATLVGHDRADLGAAARLVDCRHGRIVLAAGAG